MTQLVHVYFTVFKYFCPLRVETWCEVYTVQPRLSALRLTGLLIIRTWTKSHTYTIMYKLTSFIQTVAYPNCFIQSPDNRDCIVFQIQKFVLSSLHSIIGYFYIVRKFLLFEYPFRTLSSHDKL